MEDCTISNEPFLLKPTGKDYLWGGTRLKKEYNKNFSIEPLAETWECSTHPEGASVVSTGDFCGRTLDDVLKQYPSLLGKNNEKFTQFPIMIKFVDAQKDLSVQVHAIGAGALIAEIQQNSNITYRLYDYNRTDKNGKKRELHIDKAIDVINLSNSTKPKQQIRNLKFINGYAKELLCKCEYFQVEKILLNTNNYEKTAQYKTDNLSYHVLLCVEGTGQLNFNNKLLEFCKGDCIFVPANSTNISIYGNAIFLDVNS